MKSKKLLGLVLATSMVFSMCACGSGDSAGSTTAATTKAASNGATAAATEAATEKTVEKPDKITWWTHDGLNEEDWVKEWDAAFSELSGVTLEHTQVSNNEYYELLEISFASATEPNVFDLAADTKLAYYASQGGVADLTDLIKSSGIYDKVDPALWESVSIDGRIYGIPGEMPSGAITYVRQDWLDKLGMNVPTTYEEYIEMLRKFKAEIPECKYPITAPGLVNAQYLPEFYWDATPDFAVVDGKWVDGMQEENMVGALQRLQDAYKEGLIDMESVTNSTSACRDKWYAGEVGVFTYWAGKWGNTLQVNLQTNVPEAYITGIDALAETKYRYSGFKAYCIDGRLSEEEVEQVFTYFHKVIFDGAEGQQLLYCGVDGKHSTKDANGYITYNKMNSNPESEFQSVWGSPWSCVVPFDQPELTPQPAEMVTTTLKTMEENGIYKSVTPVSDTYNTIVSDLTAVRQECIANIVMGKVTVEEGLANYKKQADALGVAQVLQEMNQ